MNRDILQRLQEAGKYEKMAIKALFPERMAAHLDIIEREARQMIAECVVDILEQHNQQVQPEKKDTEADSKVKKITIG